MLTKVYLEGSMGESFGREWELEANSPRDALLLIDANRPGLVSWMRRHAETYMNYQVVVEYEDGRVEELNDETYPLQRKMKSIRFVPLVQGAGKWGQAIVGAILIIIGLVLFYFGFYDLGAQFIQWGSTMFFTGVISGLTTKTPRMSTSGARQATSLSSDMFGDAQSTVQQGTPVPLIYGKHLVYPSPISAGLIIEQVTV